MIRLYKSDYTFAYVNYSLYICIASHMTGGRGQRRLGCPLFRVLVAGGAQRSRPKGSKVVLPPLFPLPWMRATRNPTVPQAFPHRNQPPPPPARAATPGTPRGRGLRLFPARTPRRGWRRVPTRPPGRPRGCARTLEGQGRGKARAREGQGKGKARAREGRGWEGQREEEERYPVDV